MREGRYNADVVQRKLLCMDALSSCIGHRVLVAPYDLCRMVAHPYTTAYAAPHQHYNVPSSFWQGVIGLCFALVRGVRITSGHRVCYFSIR